MKEQFKSVRKVLSTTVIAAIIATSVTPAYAASSYTTYVNASKATDKFVKAGLPKQTSDEKRIASLESTARKEVAKLTSKYKTKKSLFTKQITSQHNKVVSYEALEDKAEKGANDAIKKFEAFKGNVTVKTTSTEVTAHYNDALKVINNLKYANVKSAFISKLTSIKSDITKKIAGLQVSSISNISDIKVNGKENVPLPKTVVVTLVNGTKVSKAVQWNQTNFSKAGTYTVYGTVADTTKKASVKVVVAGPVMIANSEDYVHVQDFKFSNNYNAGYFAYKVGFKLDVNELPSSLLKEIKITLIDEKGNTIATKTASGTQIDQLKVDGGMISTEFIQSDKVVKDDWWTSSAYDLTTPSKAVIQITDKYQNIYKVENSNPSGIPNSITLASQNGTSSYADIQSAVDAAQDGDSIYIPKGTYELNKQIRIEKSLTLIGAGDSTVIKKGSTSWTNTTGTKGYASLITVNSGDKAVKLQNITVIGAANITMTGSGSGTDYGSGINVVSSSDVTLNNITTTNNAAAGLIVNSSKVTANNFNTSGNSWYGVNVDKSASGEASFTLTGNGVISEATPIMSDKTTNVTVDAKGYTAYTIEGTTATVWNNKVPENFISITNSNRLYSNLENAVNAAQDGATIKVPAGTYKLNSQLRIEKSITIIGAGDSTVITKGTAPWTNATGTKGYASLITVNSGDKAVTLENLKVTGAANITMTGSGSGTDYGSGINVVSSTNVTLNNITLTNNAAAGLIVNSSNVTANDLNTGGNGWYGVNVDKKASGNASFNLTGNGVIGENTKIYSESPDYVTVNAQGYTSSVITGGAMVWTK
ncbi:glycosyl hydrolase family 28-related protein [Gottfriedia sp. NPDC058432]|uniref:glycosyl hydrolase family 28-related protein n=1 Tax=Gottfriedia sp. NPDC058432 TaxID=3346497 RepID=UPI00366388AB